MRYCSFCWWRFRFITAQSCGDAERLDQRPERMGIFRTRPCDIHASGAGDRGLGYRPSSSRASG